MKYNDLDALIEDMVKRYPVPAEACVRALRYLNRHPDFRDFVLGELIDQGVKRMIYTRRHIIKTGSKKCGRDAVAMRSSQEVEIRFHNLQEFVQWRMRDGRLLTAWDGPDLSDEADYERRQGYGHLRNAEFYARLSDEIGTGIVGEKLSMEKIAKIWTKVCDNIPL